MHTRYLAARLGAAVLLVSSMALAQAQDDLDTVRRYFAELTSLQAGFHQKVVDADNILQQVSDGQMWIQRPGKFRWDYETPYRQQIVSDGKRLWSYDEDLEQVTVQPIDKVLSATPAMLLSGLQPVEEVFEMKAVPAAEGLLHVHLQPKSDDSNINEIHLYFVNDALTRIQALDGFGNTTIFDFTGLLRNTELETRQFNFEPPPGVDVVGEPD
ncbi:MAG: outer membrane lipoprotein chaperone LolA [Halobacteria archaeon]|nr:outer membrane lipoprotein chaperone LolA [Halobacteria archaeon]